MHKWPLVRIKTGHLRVEALPGWAGSSTMWAIRHPINQDYNSDTSDNCMTDGTDWFVDQYTLSQPYFNVTLVLSLEISSLHWKRYNMSRKVFFRLHIRETAVNVTCYSHSDGLHACFDSVNSDFQLHFHLLWIQLRFSWLLCKISYLRLWAFYPQRSPSWFALSVHIASIQELPSTP